jgi:hypothetical protein
MLLEESGAHLREFETNKPSIAACGDCSIEHPIEYHRIRLR